MKKRLWVYSVVGLLVIIISILFYKDMPQRIWEVMEALGAIIGVILVLLELRGSRDLSQGTFITNLSDSFNNNDGIQKIYKKLEMGQPVTDDDTVDVVRYLTYFETVYVLLKKGAIDLPLIDDLFSYRFQLALRNRDIQRISLIRFDSSYCNLYRLDSLWCKYRKKESVLKAVNQNNYEIMVRGGKMKKDEIVLRIARPEDAVSIAALMRRVYDLLDDKTLFVCDDLAYVEKQIGSDGFAVVACDRNQRVIGSFVLRYPAGSDDNLGRDLALSQEELDRVVHMETAVVAPEYRGRGIQRLMLDYAEKLIDIRRHNIFLCTVSPDNPASCKTFERSGYQCVLTKEKYGGFLRRIYMKQM